MSVSKIDTRLFLVVLLALVVGALTGCGSSGSSTESEGTDPATTTPAKPFNGPAEITKFGQPAPPNDLQAASKVLAENLEARENADFAKQCASLNAEAQTEITGATQPAQRKSECGAKLKALAEPLKKTVEVRKNTFDGTIDELRVKGAKAYALYHGNDGKNYAMPLQQEEGSWKVGSIVTTEIG